MVRDSQRGVPKSLRLAGKVRDGVSGVIQPPVGEHHTELHKTQSPLAPCARRGLYGDTG